MLSLQPIAWYSWSFRILEGDREVARLDRSAFRERATFSLEGSQYEMRRTSLTLGTFVLERDGRLLAEATKPSAFRREFEVVAEKGPFRLQAASWFRREFLLLQGSSRLGSVKPDSAFGRAATADFPTTIPLPVRLFLVFLVLVLWQRAATGSS